MSDSSPALREPWPTIARQREGVTFGVWVFLATEILFFGGLFLGYAVYRHMYPEAFRAGMHETDIFYGAMNTGLLLTSSMTMTVAVRSANLGYRRLVVFCLALTALLGIGFLIGKGFEYNDDLIKGYFPGPHFPIPEVQAQIFWSFYWVMTGIHAVHLSIGIGLIIVTIILTLRGKLTTESGTFTAISLYWHFVDMVWITLVPLIYLIDRSKP
ncbi:MAG TPA: cytochrome c oxidase subunit 3 [Pseudolabrys sp.]|jgi:cytochrome c oxidase subunit 3|nr:cytochrome c oxidase subunit 3 [Pseudolabrys sp.]